MGEAKRRKQQDPNFGLPRVASWAEKPPRRDNRKTDVLFRQPVGIWRYQRGAFYACNAWCHMFPFFDLEEFIELAKVDGVHPEGYYRANHATRRGGYMGTDDYDEMLNILEAMGEIFR